MATFTTRVKLHFAVEADYAILYVEMEKLGFKKSAVTHPGVMRHLPVTEFTNEAASRERTLELATSAADLTKTQYSISITPA
jgi:hypothetical protein